MNSDREKFKTKLSGVVKRLSSWEKSNHKKETEKKYLSLSDQIISETHSLSIDEKLLISRILELFAFKHRLTQVSRIFSPFMAKNGGKYIGFVGPLGVGKSTVCDILVRDLKAGFVIKEPHRKNPFWAKSQENPNFMFRSQIYFLLSNIFSDLAAKTKPGISVSDTSALTDILMWAKWYEEIGHLTKEEYQLYRELVNLFKVIIPRPDLLVVLIPDSIDNLVGGIVRRHKDQPWRKGELVFDKTNLEIQTKKVIDLTEELVSRWNVPVLKIDINPIMAYEDPSLNYDYIYQIRRELGLLSELLHPKPEDGVTEAMRKMAENRDRVVIVIHAKSMFSGKTTVACLLAKELGKSKVFAFQPKAALRFTGQERAIISRDGHKIRAKTVEDNNLLTIIKIIKDKKISPKKFPYIFIDEVMLFVAHDRKRSEAVDIIEKIRKMGFHVIINGIDFTFQAKYFTFMKEVLRKVKKSRHWYEIEMSTRCRYCDRRATGTRRNKILPDGRVVIASYNDTTFAAGDSTYEPVCQDVHRSHSPLPV